MTPAAISSASTAEKPTTRTRRIVRYVTGSEYTPSLASLRQRPLRIARIGYFGPQEWVKFHSLRSALLSPRILAPGTPVRRLSFIFASGRKMVMRGGNEPLAKGEPNEQTYFRLSSEHGSHPGRPDTGCASPGGRQQDHRLQGQDQQEASQQESLCGQQQQRQTRRQVKPPIGDRP